MGVQIGVVEQPLPTTGFQVLFYDARPVVLSSPFRLGSEPNLRVGIASITNGEDAVRVYTQISDALWDDSLQGGDAAARVERLLRSARRAAVAQRASSGCCAAAKAAVARPLKRLLRDR